MKDHLKTFLGGAALSFTFISLYIVLQVSLGMSVFNEPSDINFLDFAKPLIGSLATASSRSLFFGYCY